jgi:hypothetical protein
VCRLEEAGNITRANRRREVICSAKIPSLSPTARPSAKRGGCKDKEVSKSRQGSIHPLTHRTMGNGTMLMKTGRITWKK